MLCFCVKDVNLYVKMRKTKSKASSSSLKDKDPNSAGFSYFEFIDTESIKITCLYIIRRLVCGYYLKRNKNTSYECFQMLFGKLRHIISVDQKAGRFLYLFSQ